MPALFVLAGAALLGLWGAHRGLSWNRLFPTGAKPLTAQIQSTLGSLFGPSKNEINPPSAQGSAKKTIVSKKTGEGKSVLPANFLKKETVLASSSVGTPEPSNPASALSQNPGNSNSLPAITARPAYTPINLVQNPTKSYSGLSVLVGQSQLGFLTVRVLDRQGAEFVRLYRGNLGPGNWVFEWDGKSPEGHPAAPGYYKIEVHSGSYIQHKIVQIQ